MHTVEPVKSVLKENSKTIGYKNIFSQNIQNWWSLFGDMLIHLRWNVKPSARNMWPFKTGGLSWQWCLSRQVSLYFGPEIFNMYIPRSCFASFKWKGYNLVQDMGQTAVIVVTTWHSNTAQGYQIHNVTIYV